MKHPKILKLLNEASDFKFVTSKWNIVINQSNANYDIGNKMIYIKEYSNLIFAIATILQLE